jgi:hypothetical protein
MESALMRLREKADRRGADDAVVAEVELELELEGDIGVALAATCA